MADILTLTVNPSIDISTTVEKIAPIHKLRCSEPLRDPGGGGINVARVAVRFGADVKALYASGGAVGALLQKLVEREGIPSQTIAVSEETRESFTVFEERSGREYRFVLPGPHMSDAQWKRVLKALAEVEERPRYVVASGSLSPGIPDDFYARAAETVETLGAKFVLDTSGPSLQAALNKGVYLFKPNLRELRELSGHPLTNESSWISACRKLIANGATEAVALTLGDQGALLVTKEEAWRARGLEIEVRSTVGAGDSFLGALVASLAAGKDMAKAFQYGVAAGSAALLSPGTGLCGREDVERLLAEVQLEQR